MCAAWMIACLLALCSEEATGVVLHIQRVCIGGLTAPSASSSVLEATQGLPRNLFSTITPIVNQPDPSLTGSKERLT